jgi:hypothetical protein
MKPKPPFEVVNDMVKDVFAQLFRVAEYQNFTPPLVVEVTDADNECVCRMLLNAELSWIADHTLPDVKNKLDPFPFPFTVVLTDHNGKELRATIYEPKPNEGSAA